MRKVLFAMSLVAATAVLSAQAPATTNGIGQLPGGWTIRLDNPKGPLSAFKATAIKGGLQFALGPEGIVFRPSDVATGTYEVKATFTQLKPTAHAEPYGLFIGGTDIEGWGQKYTYFSIMQNGRVRLFQRLPNPTQRYYPFEQVQRLVTRWIGSATVVHPDGEGKLTNVLAIKVAKDSATFFVNGTAVFTEPRQHIDTDGVAGIRVNHGLQLQVLDFSISGRAADSKD